MGDRMGRDLRPMELSGYLKTREAILDMAKVEQFDRDTRIANDMAKVDGTWRIQIGHYAGKEFMEIRKEGPRYCYEIVSCFQDKSDPEREVAEWPLVDVARYIAQESKDWRTRGQGNRVR